MRAGGQGEVQEHGARLPRDDRRGGRARPGQGLGAHRHRLLHAGPLKLKIVISYLNSYL